MIKTRPGVPPSHASESEHRRQLANAVNLLNQTTPFDLTESVQFFVGKSGDFTSINNALKALSARRPRYAPNGVVVTLTLGSGFEMAEQVLVYGIDLSWITLTSEEDEVTISRDALIESFTTSDDVWTGADHFPAFGARDGAKLPVLDVLFSMDTSGSSSNRHGILLINDAHAIVRPGAGIKNAGGTGAYVINESSLSADGAIFDGALDRGIWGRWGCNVSFNQGSAVGVGWTAFAIQSGHGSCVSADLRNAGHYGVRSRRSSIVEAQGADVSGSAGHGCNCNEASLLNFREGTAVGCGVTDSEQAILATEGSQVNAMLATVTGAGTNALLARGAYIDFRGGEASSAGAAPAIRVHSGGMINANEATGTLSQTANTLTAAGIIFQQ